MPEDLIKNVGRFGIGINLFQAKNGALYFETLSNNEGVPEEIAIMQVRVFLKKAENEYFNEFAKTHSDQ